MDRQKIHFLIHERAARVVPGRGIFGMRYDDFRFALQRVGSFWDPALKAYLVPLNVLDQVTRSVQAANFQPELSPRLLEYLLKNNIRPKDDDAEAHLAFLRELIAPVFEATGKKPRGYQWHAIKTLYLHESFFNLSDMGTGKTMEGALIVPRSYATLVLCPKSVTNTWFDEIKLWRPDLRPVILKGRGSFRWPRLGEVVIVNYDILPMAAQIRAHEEWGIVGTKGYRLVSEVRHDPRVDKDFYIPWPEAAPDRICLLADEVQTAQNPATERGKALRAILRHCQSRQGRRYGLTGTPIRNHPKDFANLIEAFDLMRQSFGNFATYASCMGGERREILRKDGTETGRIVYTWNPPDEPSPATVEALKRISIRYDIDTVAPEIPPMSFQDIRVDLDDITIELCDRAMEVLKEHGISVEQAVEMSRENRLRGAPFEAMSAARLALAVAKSLFAMEIADQAADAGETLLVTSWHQAAVELFGKRPGWKVIHGKTPAKQRKIAVDEFQDNKLPGLGITVKAGGLGLTLTAARIGIAIDESYVDTDNEQLQRRIRRIGQTRPTLWKRLVADHRLDIRLMEITGRKRKYSAAVKATALPAIPEQLDDIQTVAGAGVIVGEPTQMKLLAPSERRVPRNEQEEWAALGIKVLSELDPDEATERNKVGFSARDSKPGRTLASRLEREGGLTDGEWLFVVEMMKRYPDQIGECP